MASFSGLPALKTGDLEAGMVMGSLVRGLTPGRAARSPCVCGDNLFAGCAANRIGSVLLEAQGQKNNLGGSYVEIHS